MALRIKIDAIDWKILKVLAGRGRITKTELSEAVALSPTPCHERMRRLEESGVIAGYRAEVDLSAISSLVYFITTIRISDYEFAQVKAFEAACIAEPAILECISVLGETDYVMKTATLDFEEYESVVTRLFRSQSFTVHYTTHPVSRTLKSYDQLGLLDRCKPTRAR